MPKGTPNEGQLVPPEVGVGRAAICCGMSFDGSYGSRVDWDGREDTVVTASPGFGCC